MPGKDWRRRVPGSPFSMAILPAATNGQDIGAATMTRVWTCEAVSAKSRRISPKEQTSERASAARMSTALTASTAVPIDAG